MLIEITHATVLSLESDKVQIFSLPPKQAVMAAYAQSLGDYNTWEYEQRYGKLPQRATYGWLCGEFWAKHI